MHDYELSLILEMQQLCHAGAKCVSSSKLKWDSETSEIIVVLIIKVHFSVFQSGLLGVFQKLIASKLNDHEGFYLLQSLIEHLPE
jgi:hypothetical protein